MTEQTNIENLPQFILNSLRSDLTTEQREEILIELMRLSESANLIMSILDICLDSPQMKKEEWNSLATVLNMVFEDIAKISQSWHFWLKKPS